MPCPRCQAEVPLWARFCTQCGAQLLAVPEMEGPARAPPPPPDLEAQRPVPAPPQPPPDLRPYLAMGAVLALVSTLVIPPLTGGVAVALGWKAYKQGDATQRRQGLQVMIAGVVGTAVGLAIGIWVDQADILA